MRRIAPLLLPLVLAACGTDVAGPSATFLTCLFGDTEPLAVGGVVQTQGGEVQSVCLSSPERGDYVFIPFFGERAPGRDDPVVRLAVELTGGEFITPPATATPAERLLSIRRAPDSGAGDPFHDRLRQREIEELGPRIRATGSEPGGRTGSASPPGGVPTDASAGSAAGAGGAAVDGDPADGRPVAGAPPEPGALLELNVAISCEETDLRIGRVEYVSEHAIVVADTGNPVSLPASDYEFLGVTFDTLVYPVETAHFGTPSDIDDNGRAIIFFTRAVNQLTPAGSSTVTAGFFWSGDLFPGTATPRLEACPGGNQGEIFYMRSADPLGEYGPPLGSGDVRDVSVGVIGHELQHLINASRRLWVNEAPAFEEPWLNEGLSHIAEELLFYAMAELEPGMNLDLQTLRDAPNGIRAFNRYMGPNFSNFTRYLEQPDTASLMGIDNLATRGATWSFLRYAADRSAAGDGAFLFDLVNAQRAGLENLRQVLGASPLAWMQDWTVSVYGDDRVPGLDERYSQRSWNFRDLYRGTEIVQYPLDTPRLTSGSTLTLDLLPGGTAYPLFTLRADGRGAVHVESGGDAPPSSLRGSFLRIR